MPFVLSRESQFSWLQAEVAVSLAKIAVRSSYRDIDTWPGPPENEGKLVDWWKKRKKKKKKKKKEYGGNGGKRGSPDRG